MQREVFQASPGLPERSVAEVHLRRLEVRLTSLLIAALLLMAAAGGWTTFRMQQIDGAFQDLVYGLSAQAFLAQQMRVALLSENREQKAMWLRGSDATQFTSYASAFLDQENNVRELRSQVDTGLLSPDERARLATFDSNWATFLADWSSAQVAFGGPGGGNVQAANDITYNVDLDATSALDGIAQSLTARSDAASAALVEQGAQSARLAYVLLAVFTVVGMICALYVVHQLAKIGPNGSDVSRSGSLLRSPLQRRLVLLFALALALMDAAGIWTAANMQRQAAAFQPLLTGLDRQAVLAEEMTSAILFQNRDAQNIWLRPGDTTQWDTSTALFDQHGATLDALRAQVLTYLLTPDEQAYLARFDVRRADFLQDWGEAEVAYGERGGGNSTAADATLRGIDRSMTDDLSRLSVSLDSRGATEAARQVFEDSESAGIVYPLYLLVTLLGVVVSWYLVVRLTRRAESGPAKHHAGHAGDGGT